MSDVTSSAATRPVPVPGPLPTPTPSLKPAYYLTANLAATLQLGTSKAGPIAQFIPIPTGKLSTVVGYTPILEGIPTVPAGDWVYADPDGAHLRTDARGILGRSDGEQIGLRSAGIVDVTPEVALVFSGAVKDLTTAWGVINSRVTLQAPGSKFAMLQDRTFISTGRFVVENGEVRIEYVIYQFLGN